MIPQLQFIDKVFDVRCAGPAVLVLSVWRQSSSHSCSSSYSLDKVVEMPVVFNDRCWVSECVTAKDPQLPLTVVDVPAGAVHRRLWTSL